MICEIVTHKMYNHQSIVFTGGDLVAKSKKIKFINYIVIDGQRFLMSELSVEERREIAIRLNDTAMAAIGYTRSDKTA